MKCNTIFASCSQVKSLQHFFLSPVQRVARNVLYCGNGVIIHVILHVNGNKKVNFLLCTVNQDRLSTQCFLYRDSVHRKS